MDRKITRSGWSKFSKKLPGISFFTIFAVISGGIYYNDYVRNIPPDFLINNVSYSRNLITIPLTPGTEEVIPRYRFGKTSENQYFLELDDSRINFTRGTTIHFGNLQKIEMEQIEPRKSRLVFTFKSLQEEPEMVFSNYPAQFEITYNQNSDKKFRVVIDPGHGGSQPGAIGPGGTIEKNVVMDISNRLRDLLAGEQDIEVYMTREDDTHIGLYDRMRFSNFWEADLFVSIHANSSYNREINQTEVYYRGYRRRWRNRNAAVNQDIINNSQNAANVIKNELQNLLGIGRGVIRTRGFAVLRGNNARLGSVLVETMYISNPAGETMLISENYQNLIAQGLYNSINKIFDRANKPD